MEHEGIFNINKVDEEVLNSVKSQYDGMHPMVTEVIRTENKQIRRYLKKLTEGQGKSVFIPFDLSDALMDVNNKPYADYTFSTCVENFDEIFSDRVMGIEVACDRGDYFSYYVHFEHEGIVDSSYVPVFELNKILRTAMYIVTECKDLLKCLMKVTSVMFFRTSEGKVIAVFPHQETQRGCFLSYILGEGFASCDINAYSDFADREEYEETYAELLRQGYLLKVLNEESDI